MGYVAVKGGTKAIEESIRRLKYERYKHRETIAPLNIKAGMRCLIDTVMSESSLYDEDITSVAIKQAEGSAEEAVFLLRAYRSTLPRNHYSITAETAEMTVDRRISASFKDIPGGQILGPCYDYTHRLIDFDITAENKKHISRWLDEYEKGIVPDKNSDPTITLPRVSDYLRREGLIRYYSNACPDPKDVTKEVLQFPTERSQRLQILTRGLMGAVVAFGYAAIRGFGVYHPTVSELRLGNIPIYAENPINPEDENDSYCIGDIRITETETLFPTNIRKAQGINSIEFSMGYGICFGQNETKSIAMSILDYCLETKDPRYPTHDEEFVLLHIDSVEASGFISHLKLPHYVTFQSELDSVRKTQVKQN